MISITRFALLLAALVVCESACDSDTDSADDWLTVGEWEDLEFPHVVHNLKIEDPSLFVAAGKEGLWRKDLRRKASPWEFVGLAHTSETPWTIVGVSHVEKHILAANSPENVEVGTVGVMRRPNDLNTWVRSDSGMITDTKQYSFIDDIARSPTDPTIVVAVAGDIYRSADSGISWERVFRGGLTGSRSGLSWNPGASGQVWAYWVSPFDTYVLLKSLDGGQTWAFSDQALATDIEFMAFDAEDPSTIYASNRGAALRSQDDGETWQTIFRSTLAGTASHGSVGGIVFFATSAGLAVSKNSGITRTTIPLPRTDIEPARLLFDGVTSSILVTGKAGNVYRYKYGG
ncbi:MAG: hypothetical protein HKN13_15065 [Rhodothermales bacterium]|nr:hypothetical protein [Rhodothermales bacterium]